MRDELLRSESPLAEVRHPPRAGLFGKKTREAFAVQIEPLITDTVGAGGKVRHALFIERVRFLLI